MKSTDRSLTHHVPGERALTSQDLRRMTDEEYESYAQTHRRSLTKEPVLTAARYCSDTDRFVLSFGSGVELGIPRTLIRGFEHAGPDTLGQAEVIGYDSVYFGDADEGFSAQEVAVDLFGMWTYFGRMGGQARTEAKSASSRANGKKGGRPRRSPQPEVKTAA